MVVSVFRGFAFMIRRTMNAGWQPRPTTTHQDHVIAHVIGARVLGYFILDEALYLLLDIGFVWMIFLDGEMGLLPHPVAIGELEVTSTLKEEIKADIDMLLAGGSDAELLRLVQPAAECHLNEVSFFEHGEQRKLILAGDESSLTVETSLETAEIKVYE